MNNNKNILICYNINNTNLFLQYVNTINDIVSNYNEQVIKIPDEYDFKMEKKIHEKIEYDLDIFNTINNLLYSFIYDSSKNTKSIKNLIEEKFNTNVLIFNNLIKNYYPCFKKIIYNSFINLINKLKTYYKIINTQIDFFIIELKVHKENNHFIHIYDNLFLKEQITNDYFKLSHL